MTVPTLGKLVDQPLRQAWGNETTSFTPWLAENLDAIGEVVGIPLEFEQREVPVEEFFADILARNTADQDSRVLIENQLEKADHRHLGQILTYMAGLDVRKVIWIAESFRSAHLSAIKWLNENTADVFSFFAVRVRAVRIGDSAIASVFEVVERPNEFERELRRSAPVRSGLSEEGQKNGAFWDAYLAAHPGDMELGFARQNWRNNNLTIADGVVLSVWASTTGYGIYLRHPETGGGDMLAQRIAPVAGEIEHAVGAPFRSSKPNQLFAKRGPGGGHDDPANWPRIIDWLHAETLRYITALRRSVLTDEDAE